MHRVILVHVTGAAPHVHPLRDDLRISRVPRRAGVLGVTNPIGNHQHDEDDKDNDHKNGDDRKHDIAAAREAASAKRRRIESAHMLRLLCFDQQRKAADCVRHPLFFRSSLYTRKGKNCFSGFVSVALQGALQRISEARCKL